MLDLEEKSETYPNQPDSVIVMQLLAKYADLGIVPTVTPTTDFPIEINRVPSQQGTDLSYIRLLAQRNGFVFYLEPLPAPGFSRGYWGQDNRQGLPQPALAMNYGPQTNLDTPINFNFNALGPIKPQVTILDPITKTAISIPAPSGLRPPLASHPAVSLRKSVSRTSAKADMAQGALQAMASSSESSDAVSATGEVDAVRYGQVLRARQLVGVAGAGRGYSGSYYVQQVTHKIQRGQYKQGFTLTREGQGAMLPLVVPPRM
jgi:hypothetical protein